MANLNVVVPISIDPKSLGELQKRLKEAAVRHIELLTEAYLVALPDETDEEQDSHRQARRELKRFVGWVKSRGDEPDTSGPAVH